jgi:putative transposase
VVTARAEHQLSGDVPGAEDRARQIADHGSRAGREDRWMRPSKFTEEQIVQALRQAKTGTPAVQVCRRLGITQTTFYRWRMKYDGVAVSDSREVRELRDENQKLRQIVANLLLERQEGLDVRRKKT